MRKLIGAAAPLAALAVVIPAWADTKSGIDAWSRGDYATAVAEWRKSAIAGDPDAQFNLGMAYKLGRGVPVDMAMAESWYRKAALQGHVEASDNYGLALFQAGKRAEALPWLEKSSARGEPRAQLVLGTMLFNGDGVERDWVRAYALMTRSSASGLPQAAATLAEMDKYISADQRRLGSDLAQRMASTGGGPSPTVTTIDVPPSGGGAGTTYPPPGGRPGKRPPPPVAVAPPPPAVVQPRPAPPVAGGGWRVQLGAFGDPNNARKLWSQVGGSFAGRQPNYVKSGALTRLLVGPYRSKAEAVAACGAVKPCVPVAP